MGRPHVMCSLPLLLSWYAQNSINFQSSSLGSSYSVSAGIKFKPYLSW